MVLLDGILIDESIPPVSTFPTVSNLGKDILWNISGEVSHGARSIPVILIHNSHELLGIEHLRTLSNVRPTDSTVIGEFDLTFSTLLSGHQDHTVSSTRTVDGCRGSILQHVDALDIVRVNTIEVTAGHAVDHIERL